MGKSDQLNVGGQVETEILLKERLGASMVEVLRLSTDTQAALTTAFQLCDEAGGRDFDHEGFLRTSTSLLQQVRDHLGEVVEHLRVASEKIDGK